MNPNPYESPAAVEERTMIIAVYFLAIIGGVVIATATICACCLAYEAFFDWRHEPHQRSYLEGREDAGQRLQNDAWWFSESSETMLLLQDLGRGMNVSEAREKWRKARAKLESPCSS